MEGLLCSNCSQDVQVTFFWGVPWLLNRNIPDAFMDFIWTYGAPKTLFSDNAKDEISTSVLDILGQYCNGVHFLSLINRTKTLLKEEFKKWRKRTNVLFGPDWHTCINYLSDSTLSGKTPLEQAIGIQPDISAYHTFHWYQPILYRMENPHFPLTSSEGRLAWLIIKEICLPARSSLMTGLSFNLLTTKILTTKLFAHRTMGRMTMTLLLMMSYLLLKWSKILEIISLLMKTPTPLNSPNSVQMN